MMVAIVGPTGSGKTKLSLDLAEIFNGEIICADSRTVYRGMDIGTAKPTRSDRSRVPHHLLDLIEPGESLSAATFKDMAIDTIRDVVARGRVAFLVGGSGLYVDSVLFDYEFPGAASSELRLRLDAMDNMRLLGLLARLDPEAYWGVDLANRRRVIRAIETAGLGRSKRNEVRADTLCLGMRVNKEIAQMRIVERVQKMLEEGFIDEVREIGSSSGWDCPALDVIGYRAFKDVILGNKLEEEGAADFVRGDMALYKKQMTWFKRNEAIEWLDGSDYAAVLTAAEVMVREFLKAS
jgi:tRNA dimethylallyltransferase